jgi:formate dehydrogenase alpha subunit
MTIIIDGRSIVFEGRPMLLEVARAGGIDIPSLCDHPDLAPFGACRICLVEVKGRKGYVPACSTAAEDGLEVRTATPELKVLRRQILELILAEHPNACLICDEKKSCDDYKSTIRKTGEVTGCVLCPENGRCELQRVVDAVGVERVHFPSARREGEVRRDDPFIDRDNSLCILCGRCVRVCHEVRGASVLTFVSRGSTTVIGTAMDRRLVDSACRFCGACVDVCPTGSLSERAVRYERPAETERRAVCPLCGQGCILGIGLRDGRILGAVPDPEGSANRGQACVKGRFLVRSTVEHPLRLCHPMVRKDGRLREASWDEALTTAAGRLSAIGAGQAAVALSAQSSCEDLFVMHRFAAEILNSPAAAGTWAGSAAAELRNLSRASRAKAPLGFRFSDICRAEAIVVFGEDLPATQPILGIEVNRAARNGAALVSVGPDGFRHAREASIKAEVPPGREAEFLSALAAVILKGRAQSSLKGEGAVKAKSGRKAFDRAGSLSPLKMPEDKLAGIARTLETRRPALFLFGPAFLASAAPAGGLAALWKLTALVEGRLIPLDAEANLKGGLEIAGAFPMKTLTGEELCGAAARREVKALYIAGPFPKLEPGAAELVILQGSYEDEMTAVADIVFPETTAFESDGLYVNVEGRAQHTGNVVGPRGEARPGWVILGELAAKMGRPGFDYASLGDIRRDLARSVPAFAYLTQDPIPREGIFLAEEKAADGALISAEKLIEQAAGRRPATPRDPDDYKGLNLARESKSLKLVRGR